MNTLSRMIMLVLLVGQVGVAEEISRTEMVKMLQPFYRGVAARYEFELPEQGQPKAKMVVKPIMSWTGQEDGLVSGDVFVWTYRGRPEVVGCIGSLPGANARGVFHEFHSLTTEKPLPAVTMLTRRIWKPNVHGISPKPVPDAGTPGGSLASRMVQMRRIARQFEPRMRVSTQSGQRRGIDNLRLLPQPLFRHDRNEIQKHPAVLDGAIFTYVWQSGGTDPELLLLLEARQTASGIQWCYAPVRFTFRELWLKHKNKEVWHHRGGNGRGTYREPYITEFEKNYPIEQVKQMARLAEST